MADHDSKELDDSPTLRGFLPGTRVFDRYVLEALAGRGGMGVVLKGFDRELKRHGAGRARGAEVPA